MTEKDTPASDWDSPWKEALQYFLERFVEFFFPDIHKAIDWKRGYEALDKEFQQIVREAESGKVLADKLFKVWRQDGEEWPLIHIEIQGQKEVGFPERIFEYNVSRLGNCAAGRLSAWRCCATRMPPGDRAAFVRRSWGAN